MFLWDLKLCPAAQRTTTLCSALVYLIHWTGWNATYMLKYVINIHIIMC